MQVSEWIKSHRAKPVTVEPDADIAGIATAFLSRLGLRDVYVVSREGLVLGFVRHRRLVQLLLAEHLPIQSGHQIIERVCGGCARELMEADFVTAHPAEELDNVLNRMIQFEVEDMPVVDDAGRIVGNINLTAVLRSVHEETI
jgi:CBS domain-containing protein